jgi:hypothetical protein
MDQLKSRGTIFNLDSEDVLLKISKAGTFKCPGYVQSFLEV